jgi:hypothetical protein
MYSFTGSNKQADFLEASAKGKVEESGFLGGVSHQVCV